MDRFKLVDIFTFDSMHVLLPPGPRMGDHSPWTDAEHMDIFEAEQVRACDKAHTQ